MDGTTAPALTAFGPAAWIDRHATAENALVATGLVIAVTVAFAAANQLLHLDAAHAVEVIGVRSPERIAAAAQAMSGRERAWRTVLTLTLDTVYPLVYGASLALTIAVVLERLNAPAGVRLLRFVPIGAAALDYLENACIVLLLTARARAAAVPLSILTPAKWLLVFVSIGVVVVASVWLAARKLSGHG